MTGFPTLGWIGLACGLVAVILFVLGLCQVADDDRWHREEGEVLEREERDEAERRTGGRAPGGPATSVMSPAGTAAPLSLGPFDCEPRVHRWERPALPIRRGEL